MEAVVHIRRHTILAVQPLQVGKVTLVEMVKTEQHMVQVQVAVAQEQ